MTDISHILAYLTDIFDSATELAMMKKTCILVSVARGPHISEDALIDALNNPDQGPVRAGLDVAGCVLRGAADAPALNPAR